MSDAQWRDALVSVASLAPFAQREPRPLRALVEEFLSGKRFTGAAGLAVNAAMRRTIALQACVPILRLGLEWYDDWSTIIVYPDAFYTHHEYVDEAGVVHAVDDVQSGEAWLHGPVVLSWPHVASGGVVIHEFAHKLDMRNDVANGMPPLHRDMSRKAWTRAFTRAYEDFCARVDDGERAPFDAYAAEDPSEFFAVASEVFFIAPRALRFAYPAVYAQLQAFYRQDPEAIRYHAPHADKDTPV